MAHKSSKLSFVAAVLLHLLEGREDKRVYTLARPIIRRIPNRCG